MALEERLQADGRVWSMAKKHLWGQYPERALGPRFLVQLMTLCTAGDVRCSVASTNDLRCVLHDPPVGYSTLVNGGSGIGGLGYDSVPDLPVRRLPR